jgi:predicted  nucleic acid-binding Zn-ribbon protein
MAVVSEALRSLQEVETQLRANRDLLERKKRALRVHEKRIASLSTQIEDGQDEIRKLKANSANQEVELRGRQEQVSKKRAQLNAVKTNKEYAAILAEIRNEEADNSKFEEIILRTLTRIDQAQSTRDELEGQLAKERQIKEEIEAKLADELSTLENRIRQLESEREKAAEQVPPDTLTIFERVADRHDGEALAPLVCVNERHGEWICGGCNMSVPVDLVNTLQSSDRVIRCTSCSRILYFSK